MKKPILLFGAPGASDVIEDLTKAQVRGYTRKDGTYVKPHTTNRQAAAAKPSGGKPPASGSSFQGVLRHKDHQLVVAAASRGEIDLQLAAEKHALGREITSDDFGPYAPAVKNLLESMDRKHIAAASRGEIDMQHEAEKAALGKPSGAPLQKSALLFGDGISDLVKAQVKGYTRSDGTYVKPHTTRRAAAKQKPTGPGRKPGGSDSSSNVGHQADALRSSSSDGDMDHWDNQQAAELLEAGDYDGLKVHLRNLDTAARDHILDHIHPDHWENLGFKPLNKQASIKKYEEKFGGSPGGESLGAAAERHGSSTAAFDDQKERAIDDAIRWANKEQGEYGTAWMRQNLPDYLSKKWGISSSHAKAALNERFGPE